MYGVTEHLPTGESREWEQLVTAGLGGPLRLKRRVVAGAEDARDLGKTRAEFEAAGR